jgi:AraC family transcriptional regulator
MMAHLEEDISVARLASECSLSPTHFARAFRQTTGLPLYRWRLERRIDKAQDLLRNSPEPLADIALSCGFADQSHFTKVFSRMVGIGPGSWRRAQACQSWPKPSLRRLQPTAEALARLPFGSDSRSPRALAA